MITKSIINKILWSTIEKYVGLWEIVWELNSFEIKNSKDTAVIILNHLYNKNLIKFYLGKWGEAEVREVTKKEIQVFFEKDKYCNAPLIGESCVKVGSTIKGEKYYEQDKIRDLKV